MRNLISRLCATEHNYGYELLISGTDHTIRINAPLTSSLWTTDHGNVLLWLLESAPMAVVNMHPWPSCHEPLSTGVCATDLTAMSHFLLAWMPWTFGDRLPCPLGTYAVTLTGYSHCPLVTKRLRATDPVFPLLHRRRGYAPLTFGTCASVPRYMLHWPRGKNPIIPYPWTRRRFVRHYLVAIRHWRRDWSLG